MIELKPQVHDRYSIELKMGFHAGEQAREEDFSVRMWIFVPSSLDITPSSFSKEEFYRSVKSNIRMISPKFELGDLVGGEALPLKNVRDAQTTEDYDYQLRLFCAIAKSAIRNECSEIKVAPLDERDALIHEYVAKCTDIQVAFESLKHDECHGYCREFLYNIIGQYSYEFVNQGVVNGEIKEFLQSIHAKQAAFGYPTVTVDSVTRNQEFIHRAGVLKKYVESMLFLRVPKKRDGVIAEQAYFSLAAGMAMLFATVVAWFFQRQFGNLTWPLFVALIISYMMKDRIKELMRFWFAHKLSGQYYDNKAKLSFRGKQIGSIKEAMDFIPSSNVPSEIEEIRNKTHLFSAEDRFLDENVILYRKKVHLDRDMMENNTTYNFSGINDIIRLQVRPFMQKMDDPLTEVKIFDETGNLVEALCEKDYYINFVMEYQYGEVTEYRRFRMVLNRDGIRSFDSIAI